MAEDAVGQSAGPATDRKNDPVQDPTENVRALDAAQRLLRETESSHVREILALRSDAAEKISKLEQRLITEQFAGVKREQALTESHRLELKGDSEKALTAALSAADKAVDKGLVGMKELILNNAQIAQAGITALTDKVEDLRATVAIIVNQKIGAGEARQEQRTVTQEKQAITGGTVALISLGSFILLSLIGLMVTLLIR